jgi:YesN/AraC family two-component response regulator
MDIDMPEMIRIEAVQISKDQFPSIHLLKLS